MDTRQDRDLLIEVATDIKHIKGVLQEMKVESSTRIGDCTKKFALQDQVDNIKGAVRWLYTLVGAIFTGIVLWFIRIGNV